MVYTTVQGMVVGSFCGGNLVSLCFNVVLLELIFKSINKSVSKWCLFRWLLHKQKRGDWKKNCRHLTHYHVIPCTHSVTHTHF